jgi:hypothetical protein
MKPTSTNRIKKKTKKPATRRNILTTMNDIINAITGLINIRTHAVNKSANAFCAAVVASYYREDDAHHYN